jgi:hypothetical protein
MIGKKKREMAGHRRSNKSIKKGIIEKERKTTILLHLFHGLLSRLIKENLILNKD